jgi:hypothetical protein
VFEQGNGGGCKPILEFLVAAYENRQAVGGRDWPAIPSYFCMGIDTHSISSNLPLYQSQIS